MARRASYGLRISGTANLVKQIEYPIPWAVDAA